MPTLCACLFFSPSLFICLLYDCLFSCFLFFVCLDITLCLSASLFALIHVLSICLPNSRSVYKSVSPQLPLNCLCPPTHHLLCLSQSASHNNVHPSCFTLFISPSVCPTVRLLFIFSLLYVYFFVYPSSVSASLPVRHSLTIPPLRLFS